MYETIILFCQTVFLVVLIILALMMFRKIRELNAEKEKNERLLEESRRKIDDDYLEVDNMKARLTLSQISPHFVFNTLNTIYYLCEKDSGQAQKAIEDFSGYLRENMDSVKKMEPVDFTEELEHVKKYLSIEKLRYDDDLNVRFEINAVNFKVPALSVQALVENAVHHGLGKSENGGTVSLSSWEGQETFCVTVVDDGVGFDVKEKIADGKSHTGIENVRHLLEKMVGGRLEVISEKGEGTKAMIRIPKQEGA